MEETRTFLCQCGMTIHKDRAFCGKKSDDPILLDGRYTFGELKGLTFGEIEEINNDYNMSTCIKGQLSEKN